MLEKFKMFDIIRLVNSLNKLILRKVGLNGKSRQSYERDGNRGVGFPDVAAVCSGNPRAGGRTYKKRQG
jgi:hypothetical protein